MGLMERLNEIRYLKALRPIHTLTIILIYYCILITKHRNDRVHDLQTMLLIEKIGMGLTIKFSIEQ